MKKITAKRGWERVTLGGLTAAEAVELVYELRAQGWEAMVTL